MRAPWTKKRAVARGLGGVRVVVEAACQGSGHLIALSQRFTKALTVFPHVHVLVLDGAYVAASEDEVVFIVSVRRMYEFAVPRLDT